MSKLPSRVLDLVRDFMTFRGEAHTRENEVAVLRLLVRYTEKDLVEGTCPNPGLATENLKWFKLRLDELGAGEVRA